ncbi:GTP-binding protein [Rhizobium sp. KVB221]|uniref:GTP-binding protein n=1 Tax=Rhizobium setariae TaxID=2801340 RepID=A0A937CMA7_9HYPH|nr:GTP-binding protein [Rhizobium setariae]MBL0372546.1 GTP-binding protein [Rhizobium setariae]
MTEIPLFTTVNLLTGFLGSGKTTLLKRLLNDPALADAAVLINEFGETGLDHHLVERIDENMVLLQSGCVCCTVRGELAEAIRDLLSKRDRGIVPPFKRLVIESTGLADPFPVLSTLKADPVLRHHFKAGNVITTVDAVNGARSLDTYLESNRQIAVADRLVITKSDLVDEATMDGLIERITRINPDCVVLDVHDEALSVADLLDSGDFVRGEHVQSATGFYCEDSRDLLDSKGAPHSAEFRSFSITVDRPVDWTAFGIWLTMLINRHGERVLRVKGILDIAGEDRPVAIHGVQHLVHTPVHMQAWTTEERQSRIVFIVDGLDPKLLRRSFEAFALVDRVPVQPATVVAQRENAMTVEH